MPRINRIDFRNVAMLQRHCHAKHADWYARLLPMVSEASVWHLVRARRIRNVRSRLCEHF
jgi:hypothetical protein